MSQWQTDIGWNDDPVNAIQPPAFRISGSLVPEPVNSAPVTDADGPYEENEGTPVIFDGSGSSDPDGDPLEYRWDFEDDGTWDTPWSTDPTADHTYGDNWSGQVRLEVSDGAMTDTDLASVTINNVAPDAWIGFVNQPNPDFILPHHVLTFGGSFTDPGWLDIHEALWDFDNGTTAPGIVVEENNPPDATGDASVQYAFPQPGIYSVTLTINDDGGGNVISAPWIVTVLTGPQEMLAVTSEFFDDSVELGALVGEGSGGSAENRLNAMRNMLEEAQSLIEAGLYEEACDQLWAAYRKCDGDPRPPDFVTGDAAGELANMIMAVIVELGCE